jgi:structural maintenance of chromosome 4
MAQARGHLRGIFGRLGDLGKIDRRYDIPVSNASSLLDHILVQTMDQAERCTNYLRKHRIGVGKFLILEFCKHEPNPNFRVPEDSKRLIDLIKCDNPDIIRALYKAFGDTLVANDIITAEKIAYNP